MSQFILVRQLNPAETTKAIRLRLVRTYDLPEKGKPNLIKSKECLFHDSEGVFVHGHIPKEFVTQFRSSFIEGQIYSIHNFCPVSNFFRYKTTKNKYMIKFHKNTKVYEQVYANNNGDFPRHMFRLRTFESFLQAGQIDDKELIDVIGRVVKIYNPMEVNVEGNPCKLIDFLIEDNSLRETETVTKSVSSISRFFGGNIFDDLTSNDINLTTICAIYNKHQVGDYFVIAKIVGIETGKDWFYTACMNNKCRKKLAFENGSFFCAKCEKSCPRGILKYKVQLRVYDGVDDAALLLWDRDCAELLGLTAYNLNEKYLESDDLPVEIEQLCGKWLIFKINVTKDHFENQGKAIPISRVIIDEALITANMPNYQESHDQDLNSILEQEKGKDAEDFLIGCCFRRC